MEMIRITRPIIGWNTGGNDATLNPGEYTRIDDPSRHNDQETILRDGDGNDFVVWKSALP